MDEQKHGFNDGMKRITVVKENLKLIRGYIRVLESNYSKKKEETIRAITKAGYTVDDIANLKEKYYQYFYDDEKIKAIAMQTDINEMIQTVERLKSINESIIEQEERNTSSAVMTGSMKTSEDVWEERENEEASTVTAEIISAEEFAEMRRMKQELKAQKDTEEMFRIINERSDRARRNTYSSASVEEQSYARVGAEHVDYAGGGSTRSRDFRRSIAYTPERPEGTTYGRQGGRERVNTDRTRSKSYDGKRILQDNKEQERRTSQNRRRKRNVRKKAKTLSGKKLVRNISAGLLAISVLAGAYAVHANNEYKEDVANRIEYVDNIIDRDGTAQDYMTYCGVEFTEEDLAKFLEVEGKIDGYAGKTSEELGVVDVMTTAEELKQIYQDIVREKLEDGFGVKIEEETIKVTRIQDTDDGKAYVDTNKGNISEIGYMSMVNDKKIPKELRAAIVAAYGGVGIEKPATTVTEVMNLLDNQKITKEEAASYLATILEDVKELMTRKYVREDYGEIEEVASTYDIVKEREAEIAKTNADKDSHTNSDDEIDR